MKPYSTNITNQTIQRISELGSYGLS